MNFNNLQQFFVAKKHLIKNTLLEYEIKNLPKQKRHYVIDNGAPILLVSHIDTVQTPLLNRNGISGAGFDDRLGVYLAYKLSKAMPHLFDALFTDYEETGKSTAKYFSPTHDYNFVIGLDRIGDDYVDYGLASDCFCSLFEYATNIAKSHGSFSDICNLINVECSKINIGIGVQNSHAPHSFFNPIVCKVQIYKLVRFCIANKDTHFTQGVGDVWGTHFAQSYEYDDMEYASLSRYINGDVNSDDYNVLQCANCDSSFYSDDMRIVFGEYLCIDCVHDLSYSDIATKVY